MLIERRDANGRRHAHGAVQAMSRDQLLGGVRAKFVFSSMRASYGSSSPGVLSPALTKSPRRSRAKSPSTKPPLTQLPRRCRSGLSLRLDVVEEAMQHLILCLQMLFHRESPSQCVEPGCIMLCTKYKRQAADIKTCFRVMVRRIKHRNVSERPVCQGAPFAKRGRRLKIGRARLRGGGRADNGGLGHRIEGHVISAHRSNEAGDRAPEPGSRQRPFVGRGQTG